MLKSQNRYNRGIQNISGKVPQPFMLAGSQTESVKITVSGTPKITVSGTPKITVGGTPKITVGGNLKSQ